MEISCIHMQMLVRLHVNKIDFHMKGFALGLTLKQRQKATRKSPIDLLYLILVVVQYGSVFARFYSRL